jgi:hypothetical protein
MIGLIGRARKEVTPALLTVFADALGIPAGDLAALAGMSPPEGNEIPPGGPSGRFSLMT